ncbi:MAG: hypothetical protein R3Y59_07150 [bacterium]
MKNISQHIEDLIIKHNCVIVPQLGGFLTYQASAYISNNKLHAPMHQIRFNNLLSHQDGLLTEAYMAERGLSYADAIETINREVEEIFSVLERGESYILGRLGLISMGENKKVVFTANSAFFLPENFGLASINLVKLPQTTDNKIVITLPRNNSNFIRYAAAVAILFVFTFFVPTTIKDSAHHATISFDSLQNLTLSTADVSSAIKTEEIIENILVEAKTATDETKNVDLIQIFGETMAAEAGTVETGARGSMVAEAETMADDEAGTTETETIETEVFATEAQVIVEVENTEPEAVEVKKTKRVAAETNDKYHLIVASLTSRAQAEKYIAEQKNFDPNQLQIITKDNKFRISAKGFDSYQMAVNYMDSIRENKPTTKNAWILRN